MFNIFIKYITNICLVMKMTLQLHIHDIYVNNNNWYSPYQHDQDIHAYCSVLTVIIHTYKVPFKYEGNDSLHFTCTGIHVLIPNISKINDI